MEQQYRIAWISIVLVLVAATVCGFVAYFGYQDFWPAFGALFVSAIIGVFCAAMACGYATEGNFSDVHAAAAFGIAVIGFMLALMIASVNVEPAQVWGGYAALLVGFVVGVLGITMGLMAYRIKHDSPS